MRKLKKSLTGFTLVEVMVSVFVFTILMTVVGSAFVGALNDQRKSFNTQQVLENSSLLLESMAKEVRVSQINDPDNVCPLSPSSSLSVIHPVNGPIVYALQGTDILRNGSIINSNTVEFTRLQFCVSGSALSDGRQPRVTVIASARSKNTKGQALIDIQTTLSQRLLSN